MELPGTASDLFEEHGDDRTLESERATHDVPRWLARGAGWSWRLLVVVAALALILFVVSRLVVAVVPVVGALFCTAILGPPARWLRARGLPPLAATWIVFLFAIATIAGLAWWLAPAVTSELGDLRGTLAHGLGQIRHWLTNGPLHLSARQVDAFVRRVQSQGSAGTSVLLHGVLAGAQLVMEIVATVLLTIVLTFFFVKDGPSLAGWLSSFAEPSRRERMEGAAGVAWQTFTAYVQGTAINGAIDGTLMGLGLVILHVPLALPIAVFTFLGGFFPLVGGLVSGALAVLVALVSRGTTGALLALALAVLIHHLEGYIVGPFVLGRKVRLHAVVVILALAVGTVVGGLFGAFVAVPVTAISLALIEYYRGLPVETVASVAEGRSLPAARLAVVQWATNRKERSRRRREPGLPVPEDDITAPGPRPIEESGGGGDGEAEEGAIG